MGAIQQGIEFIKKTKTHIMNLIIPTVLDVISSILSYYALNMIDGSIWQLTRGGEMITTAIFCKIIMKKMFTKY